MSKRVVGRGWWMDGRDVILYATTLARMLDYARKRYLVLVEAEGRTYKNDDGCWLLAGSGL